MNKIEKAQEMSKKLAKLWNITESKIVWMGDDNFKIVISETNITKVEFHVYEEAYAEYEQLCEVVEHYHQLSIKELCDLLEGHNYEEGSDWFDVNYGDHMCATVEKNNDGFHVQEIIEIWDDYDNLMDSLRDITRLQ